MPHCPACGASHEHWMQNAVSHPGALHEHLGVPQGQNIPSKKLAAAEHSPDPEIKKEATLAETFKKYRPG